MRYAIRIKLKHNDRTIFIIDGFKKKEITKKELINYILLHFEWMNGTGNVTVEPKGEDFSVKAGQSHGIVNFEWEISYKYK